MTVMIEPGLLAGAVTPPPSKSQAHRLLIARALAGENLDDPAHRADSQDIRATRDCLKSLREGEGELPVLECGESGSTLRFLIPVALALRGGGVFRGRGRLMDRPQEPYFRIFDGMGITHRREGDSLTVRGRLRPGEYPMPGDVSSQFVTGLLFALPLGLIISFGSMSRFSPLRWLTKTFVWIIRGSPLMLQILIVFYGPGLLFGWKALPRFTAALVTFVINYACYFSEIYRGGIQGVPKGQQEAGQVLGMTKSQIFFKVTLLQVVKRIVPPMGNEFITLVKDTSLVRVISVYEIIWVGESFIKKGMIWPLFYCMVFYLLFSGALTLALGWVERKLSYFK